MLEVRDLAVRYGSRRALDGVTLQVPAGRTLAIVGPSGAGKSTLLRAIAGLERLACGDVSLDGRSIAALAPQARHVALVFQNDALFERMSVRANLRFALRSRDPGGERVAAAAAALRVSEHLDRHPGGLSGGERQRVAIARALLSDPAALLLDEPLAHVDPSLRVAVRDEVLGVRARFGGPIVYVTHDHAEAMSVGDELAVLVDGRIEDAGDPQRVYDAPRTIAAARALGERAMNLLPSNGAIVGIRPERVRVVESAGAVRGRVTRRESTGADAYLRVDTELGEVVARVPAGSALREGDETALEFPSEHVRRFDAGSGAAIE